MILNWVLRTSKGKLVYCIVGHCRSLQPWPHKQSPRTSFTYLRQEELQVFKDDLINVLEWQNLSFKEKTWPHFTHRTEENDKGISNNSLWKWKSRIDTLTELEIKLLRSSGTSTHSFLSLWCAFFLISFACYCPLSKRFNLFYSQKCLGFRYPLQLFCGQNWYFDLWRWTSAN